MSTSRVWGTAGGRQCQQVECGVLQEVGSVTKYDKHMQYTQHTLLCVHMCVSMCVCTCSCVHVVRGHFSCEVPLLNIISLQFGCLPANLSTHQNSNRELLLGPEGRRGKEKWECRQKRGGEWKAKRRRGQMKNDQCLD